LISLEALHVLAGYCLQLDLRAHWHFARDRVLEVGVEALARV
jgi:hypothetical protein